MTPCCVRRFSSLEPAFGVPFQAATFVRLIRSHQIILGSSIPHLLGPERVRLTLLLVQIVFAKQEQQSESKVSVQKFEKPSQIISLLIVLKTNGSPGLCSTSFRLVWLRRVSSPPSTSSAFVCFRSCAYDTIRPTQLHSLMNFLPC